jgi:hypothetical protein
MVANFSQGRSRHSALIGQITRTMKSSPVGPNLDLEKDTSGMNSSSGKGRWRFAVLPHPSHRVAAWPSHDRRRCVILDLPPFHPAPSRFQKQGRSPNITCSPTRRDYDLHPLYKVSLLVIPISPDSDQQHHKRFPPVFQTILPSSRSANNHMAHMKKIIR